VQGPRKKETGAIARKWVAGAGLAPIYLPWDLLPWDLIYSLLPFALVGRLFWGPFCGARLEK